MIAPCGIRCHVRQKLIACAPLSSPSFNHCRLGRGTVAGVAGCSGPNHICKGSSNFSHKTRQRPWCLRDMENRFVLEGIAAHHVHVNVGPHPLTQVGMSGEESHRAFNLRTPDKSQSAFGRRQSARLDQVHEHARRLENGDATTSVVVRARTLVVKMATVNDLAGSWI